MNDLFSFTEGNLGRGDLYQPLADRMRPSSLDEIFGQEHILEEGKPLRLLLESGQGGSVIFWGPPGCGKTTLARVLAQKVDADFIQLSAVTSGVKDLKAAFEQAKNQRRRNSRKTLLFVDEIHRFNKAQQDALLPHIESGTVIFVGATTENPSFEVVSALLSRCQLLVLKSLTTEAIIPILIRALEKDEKLNRPNAIEVKDDALTTISVLAAGDARIALNMLETCCEVARQKNPQNPVVEHQLVAEAFQTKGLRYDKGGEEHYNLISALHKSMRGSDPDASLYWLYRMIEGGEDCKFILRRMIRFASEDIGMADPFALTLAMSASQAFAYIGPPEGHIHLAHLAVYFALAPKSNSLYLAEKRVVKEIRGGGEPGVPLHLRNAPTQTMKSLGYGNEYKYPHDFQGGFVKENYFPEGVKETHFFRPTVYGKEKNTRERMKALWPERFSGEKK